MSFIAHPRVQLGLRLALAAMFIWASLDKILDPRGFAKIVYQWQVGGAVFSNVVAVVLPWVELFAGLFLLFGVWVREAALVTAALLLSFNLAAASVLARGIDVENCGCTSVKSASAHTKPSPFRGVGWFLITRNMVLLAAALAVVFRPARRSEAAKAADATTPQTAPAS